MLTEDQILSVWERQLAAEVRSLYFGELANMYTVQKQWISGLSFFLASSAAATIVAKSPAWVPILLAFVTAILSAYSIARGLDGATRTMAKFQFAWSELAAGYELLWNTTWQDYAIARLAILIGREQHLSRQGVIEAPHDPSRMDFWQQQVFKQHHLIAA